MDKKIIAVSLVAASVGVATYIFFKRRKDNRKKNLPVSFI